jgi:hypothetical protein
MATRNKTYKSDAHRIAINKAVTTKTRLEVVKQKKKEKAYTKQFAVSPTLRKDGKAHELIGETSHFQGTPINADFDENHEVKFSLTLDGDYMWRSNDRITGRLAAVALRSLIEALLEDKNVEVLTTAIQAVKRSRLISQSDKNQTGEFFDYIDDYRKASAVERGAEERKQALEMLSQFSAEEIKSIIQERDALNNPDLQAGA